MAAPCLMVDIKVALASLKLAPPRLSATRDGCPGGFAHFVIEPDEQKNAEYRASICRYLAMFVRKHPDGRKMIDMNDLLDHLPSAVAWLGDPAAEHALRAHDWRVTSVGAQAHWARVEAEGRVLDLADRKRKAEDDLAALERLHDRIHRAKRPRRADAETR